MGKLAPRALGPFGALGRFSSLSTVTPLLAFVALLPAACDRGRPASQHGSKPTQASREARALRCERDAGYGPERMEAQRAACRALCEQGSRRHCERLAGVCQQGIPGGTFCPAESVWATERACVLGSAKSCAYAAEAYKQGGAGVQGDRAKAVALMKRACALDPSLCVGVSPAVARAALAALTTVAVPGGTFRPGFRPYDTPNEPRDFRLPPVTLGPFDIDRTEVTVGAFAACVNAGKCLQPQSGSGCNWGRPDRLPHPMNCVSPQEAAAFCAFRGRRLPSQDEWELAARGTDDRPYPWGAQPPEDQLCWRRSHTCPVGSFPKGASSSGALDLEGNVEEWTTSTAFVTNVATFYDATVSRGASYSDSSTHRMGLNNQHYHRPTETSPLVGFRCVGLSTTPPDGPRQP